MAVECFEIVIGCDATFRFTATDEDDVAVSLTGERVRFAVKRSLVASESVLIAKDSDVGAGEVEILAAPNDNQALIKVLAADTVGLEEGTYCMSIKVDFVSTSQCAVPVNDSVDLVRSAFS